jgi:hypothetical protein
MMIMIRTGSPRLALACLGALVFSACGGNAGAPSNDAAVVPADADLGVDAVSCTALPCLADATSLVAYCAPSGACTVQVTVSGAVSTMTKCFSNGVKIQLTATNAGSDGTNMVLAVKKDGAACYSWSSTSTSNGQAGSIIYQDGAGADLFTEMVDGATETYVCPGKSPVGPDTSCDAALFALQGAYPFTNAICPAGSCTF